jgi:uncharacterized damage-inducible protein DinB
MLFRHWKYASVLSPLLHILETRKRFLNNLSLKGRRIWLAKKERDIYMRHIAQKKCEETILYISFIQKRELSIATIPPFKRHEEVTRRIFPSFLSHHSLNQPPSTYFDHLCMTFCS